MTPRLSVVLATTDAWPDLADCLARLEPQARAVGAELIIGDGDGRGLPERYTSEPDRLVWLRKPGASVFELRALGVEAARGEIIATTEDHCMVAPDWCERILAAHQAHPAAPAIAGAVENGSRDRLIDWANYLHTFGSFTAPIDPGQRARCPVNANISYKRAVLATGPIAPGWMELTLNARLFRERAFVYDDRIVVHHVQSHGVLGTFLAHFDNGRATSGLQRLPLTRRQLPWRLYRNTMRTFEGKPSLEPVVRRCWPLLAGLSTCHALGEAVGSLLGPGSSPARLR